MLYMFIHWQSLFVIDCADIGQFYRCISTGLGSQQYVWLVDHSAIMQQPRQVVHTCVPLFTKQ